ncbi:MAG: ATP-binding protein [Lamprocystis purpurea]|uniref:ATP-binding protein n=1 Tax=Lamprocystis purpurea TaxID=61598 RepID=UPI00037EDC47|nr:ATP-binding protein [Lamprocystis purpurea]MBV5275682.1 ATP-binding protein [Lamprocystis purpurea]
MPLVDAAASRSATAAGEATVLLRHWESGDEPVIWCANISLIAIHDTQNEHLQRAFATFVLHNLYQGMFRRGTQGRITHAVIFDEAHRAARLKLIPTMVKECRKYGIAFVIASQEAKDFDPSLFTTVANYLALRLNEPDAKLMAKSFAGADKVGLYTDRIKQMPKYQAMYYGEGLRAPIRVALGQYQAQD